MEVKNIKNKILDGDIDGVRYLLSSSEQIEDLDNRHLIMLAKNKSIKRIEVMLFNAFPNARSLYSQKQKEQLIIDLMAELGQEYYAAQWKAGIENDLWEWSRDLESIPGNINTIALGKALKEIKTFAQKINLWVTWTTDEMPGPIDLSLWIKKQNK